MSISSWLFCEWHAMALLSLSMRAAWNVECCGAFPSKKGIHNSIPAAYGPSFREAARISQAARGLRGQKSVRFWHRTCSYHGFAGPAPVYIRCLYVSNTNSLHRASLGWQDTGHTLDTCFHPLLSAETTHEAIIISDTFLLQQEKLWPSNFMYSQLKPYQVSAVDSIHSCHPGSGKRVDSCHRCHIPSQQFLGNMCTGCFFMQDIAASQRCGADHSWEFPMALCGGYSQASSAACHCCAAKIGPSVLRLSIGLACTNDAAQL